ncbi:MAG: hypothetical protein GSR84_04680 [Desulfurococcales archaeon]|nr:hypothetical protein [Desulfurococcales archaeon]
MKLVPSIDLDGPRAVKRVRGKPGTGLDLGDPRPILERIANLGFRKVHIVDLRGSVEGRPTKWSLDLAREARRLGLEARLGGGIRSLGHAREAARAGASEVVLGTLWALNPEEAGRIAAAIPAWAAVEEGPHGEAMIRGWTQASGISVARALGMVEDLGFRGVLYTYIPAEGTLSGVPVDRIRGVRSSTRLLLAYAGGVSTPRDLEVLEDLGVDEVVVGMALYTGSIPWEVAAGYA